MSQAVPGHNDCICWVSYGCWSAARFVLWVLHPYGNSINGILQIRIHLDRCLALFLNKKTVLFVDSVTYIMSHAVSGHREWIVCWLCPMHFIIRVTGSASLFRFCNMLQNRMLSKLSHKVSGHRDCIVSYSVPCILCASKSGLQDLHPYEDSITRFKTECFLDQEYMVPIGYCICVLCVSPCSAVAPGW